MAESQERQNRMIPAFRLLTRAERQLLTAALAGNHPDALNHLRRDVISSLAKVDGETPHGTGPEDRRSGVGLHGLDLAVVGWVGRMTDMWVVFDGPPGPESGRFVEVEDGEGHGLGPVMTGAGWRQRADGYWKLGPFSADGLVVERDRYRQALKEIAALLPATARYARIARVALGDGETP